MKRFGILVLLAALVSGVSFAQDISDLGSDFESLVEQLGKEILPNVQQMGAWGQFPGQASLPEDSRFFFTLSGGAVLGFDGVLNFVEPTNANFDFLNVYQLFQQILSSEQASGAITSIQNFFPYPIARTSLGFALPAGLEIMADFAIFPQFFADTANNLFETVPPFTLNALHFGGRVRKQLLRDAPGIPSVSIGAGYSYTGFNLAYDFADLPPQDGAGPGTIDTAIGTLHLAGELYLKTSVNSFGLDFQVSRKLGVFVPFIGLSPYYQFSGFSGGIAGFNEDTVYVDYNDGDPVQDVVYNGSEPATTFVDNDLSLLVFGGFEFVLKNVAFQFHGSYLVGETWPAATVGIRWQ